MNLLQKVFEHEASAGAMANLLADLLASKLAQRGVTLSAKQKETLRGKLSAGDYSSLTLHPWKFWKKERIELKITESDLQHLERSLETWVQRLPELVTSLADDSAATILKSLKERWRKEARCQQREARGFLHRLDQRWREPFGLLQMLLTIAIEFGESVNTRLRAVPSSSPNKIDVVTRLHARSCQVGSEILTLLRNGFADGALARWRTLHEIAVVSLFVAEGNEALAERYVLHEAVESWRAANEYERYRDRLGYEPIDATELTALEQQKSDLIGRFGPAFLESYGWAAERIGTLSPTFADIERAVGVNHLRPYYRMASHNVHANPKGVFFKLGLMSEEDLLLTGPSNMGFADPGQNTALSLIHATTGLLSLDRNLDAIVVVNVMMDLADEAAEAFVTVQKQIESG